MAGRSQIPDELAAEMTPAVRAFVEMLLAQIAELQAEVAALEAELVGLRKTPQNSSLPPSTQHPHARPPRKEPKSKRNAGGQPGHPKAERALIPTGDCTAVVPLRPEQCRRCGTPLAGDDPEPLRHQVWELPEIQPLVTEYQRHRLSCPCCGESTCAALPPGVPTGQSGPRLIAFVALLMACFRQSKRRTAEFVSTVLNIPCSSALTIKHQNIATQAARPAYEELAAALPAEPALHGDESPTKEGPAKAWLWTFVAGTFTVFALRTSRAATVLSELFGEAYHGVMHCDRAKMYWQLGCLQWCWAHLKRDVQALIDDADPQVKRLGHDLMRPTRELFRHWSRCRDGTITRRGLQRLLAPVRQQVNALLLRGVFSGNPRLVGMCSELYDHRDWLWTFLEVEGVEPTNNAAERALRPAVIWRKLSFGTQSAAGSRFVETLLSIIATCRQQDRDVFAYLTAAVETHFHDRPPPSLLPDA
jgi:transposase